MVIKFGCNVTIFGALFTWLLFKVIIYILLGFRMINLKSGTGESDSGQLLVHVHIT